MPPYPLELEEWWLTQGYDALCELVDLSRTKIKPRECGFAQAVQQRLRTFDNDRNIPKQLHSQLPAIRASKKIDYASNPRKNLRIALTSIFKSPEDRGIDYRRAIEGLGYLDAMEAHRRRLVATTRLALDNTKPVETYAPLIEELDRTASLRYGHFHMGFRACVGYLGGNTTQFTLELSLTIYLDRS